MKLIDLDPQWVGAGGDGISDKDGNQAPRREKIGVQFNCPCGAADSPCYIPFRNPPDGNPPPQEHPSWTVSGLDFATMTLDPSIQRVSSVCDCRWHGWVRNGEIINA